ncbi:hypothetical protein QDR94_14750 [Acinetobacter baumannii]|uniref:hypothetical protein n=1 Tax=Acinetobacter calcoaceticus/baumannii complex TaxID=909768 RepID=UPI001B3422D7|nr:MULTISPECIES: hypothetical protein [Acinetobacter calcoaceticus/baumannii complex]MBP4062627.1 hypothetical protein [Acinetobacter baumannii]MBR7717804.1 hypothetical protein [Acinetobacter nosocomialis]MDH2548719.1 hypothetical protein [Acinetobacter baumannii]MDH2643480.1 hypothetical protein [Acinetobacter baumannii]MDV7605402.1 hypothetical protein [Acinetobacter baumannii]
MITPFILDRDVFQCENFKKLPIVRDAILEDWANYGIFIFGTKDNLHHLVQLVRTSFPVKYKDKWLTALTKFPTYIVEENIIQDFLLESEDFNEIKKLSKYVDNVFLNSINFEIVKEFKNFEQKSQNFEVLDYIYLKDSESFKLSKIYAKKQIDNGEDVKKVWSRFKSLLTYTNKMVIVDRYLFVNDISTAYLPEGSLSSIKRFFKFMTVNRLKVKNLQFVSSNKSLKAESVKKLFDDIFASDSSLRSCFDKLIVIVRDDKEFSDGFHDRIIKTDYHYVEIGSGFGDAFRNKMTEKFMTFSCKSKCEVDYTSYFAHISSLDLSKTESKFDY